MGSFQTDAPGWLRIASPAGGVAFDPEIGNLRDLEFRHDGRVLRPLHCAAWASDARIDPDSPTPPVEQRLAGDFFCAPFGANDVEGGPAHGWSANSRWSVVERGEGWLVVGLDRRIMGARIEKRLELGGEAPLLYQSHVIEDGSGGLPVAHHPMVRLAGGGRFFCSPKRLLMTHETPLEPGRHRLGRGTQSGMLTAFPGADGTEVDLTRLPIGTRSEDFVLLVEASDARIGWSAVMREAENDIVFFLKDPSQLPTTCLWHSNAGRDYPPWNGAHDGVLGIEDACAFGATGHAAALQPNVLTKMGVATALPLAPGKRHRIAHVTGAIPRPAGWTAIAGITLGDGELTLHDGHGDSRVLPFRADFFER